MSSSSWRAEIRKLVEEFSDSGKIFIVGLGSILKGDDGVGAYVASKLKIFLRGILSVKVIVAEDRIGAALDLIKRDEVAAVFFVDAVDFSENPGSIKVFTLEAVEDSYGYTHRIPLKTIVNILKIEAPIYVIGVQPRRVEVGIGLSSEVKQAAEELTKFLVEIFEGFNRKR